MGIALLSALLWAIASTLFALGARRLHVLPLNLIRCTVSTVFFLALLPLHGGLAAIAAIPPSAWLWLAVSVLGLLVLGDTLYFRSLDLAGVSWAMPAASINPIWAVLLAALFVGEPLSWMLLAGAVLVVVGLALVGRSAAQAADDDPRGQKSRRTGLGLALLASLFWGVGQVALKPGSAGIDPVVANAVRQPMGMLILFGLNLVRWVRTPGRHEMRGLDRRSWAVILVGSLVGTGFGSLLFVMAIQLAGAGRTAVLTATAPMMAIPFSMLWLGERPTRWTLVGTLCTTLGIALVV